MIHDELLFDYAAKQLDGIERLLGLEMDAYEDRQTLEGEATITDQEINEIAEMRYMK